MVREVLATLALTAILVFFLFWLSIGSSLWFSLTVAALASLALVLAVRHHH